MHESEMIAQELSALGHKLDELDARLAAVENVNARLRLLPHESAMRWTCSDRGTGSIVGQGCGC